MIEKGSERDKEIEKERREREIEGGEKRRNGRAREEELGKPQAIIYLSHLYDRTTDRAGR